MSNSVCIHLGCEKVTNIKVIKDFGSYKEIALKLSNSADVFMTENQAEEVFDRLDEKLHKKTWLQMEEIILGLQIDIEELESTRDYYREIQEENRAI